MSHESLVSEITSKYELMPHAIRVQRAVIINAQIEYLNELGVQKMTDKMREDHAAICWGVSMRNQDQFSKRNPLGSVFLESYRTMALITAASFQVLDRLETADIQTDTLQTPTVYMKFCGLLFQEPKYVPDTFIVTNVSE